MKYTLAAAAIVFATSAVNATPNSNPVIWQGDVFIKAASAGCSAIGATVGDFAQAVFAPMGLGGNNPKQDQLAIFFPRGSAIQLVPTSGGALNSAKTVNVININSDATAKANTSQPVGPFSISTVKANEPVSISFAVPNYYSSACSVTVAGILFPRPGNLPN